MKRRRNLDGKFPMTPLPKDISPHHNNMNYILIFYYENNYFPTYKVIRYHILYIIKLDFEYFRQGHKITPHSHQHLQIKRLQHIRISQRQQVQHKLCKEAHQASRF